MTGKFNHFVFLMSEKNYFAIKKKIKINNKEKNRYK